MLAPFIEYFYFPLGCIGVNTPLTQTLFSYLGLGLIYGSIVLYRRQKLRVISFFHLDFVFAYCICSPMDLEELKFWVEVQLVAARLLLFLGF